MSEKNQDEKVDKILEALSKPICKYVLAILAGLNPGKFDEEKNFEDMDTEDLKE